MDALQRSRIKGKSEITTQITRPLLRGLSLQDWILLIENHMISVLEWKSSLEVTDLTGAFIHLSLYPSQTMKNRMTVFMYAEWAVQNWKIIEDMELSTVVVEFGAAFWTLGTGVLWFHWCHNCIKWIIFRPWRLSLQPLLSWPFPPRRRFPSSRLHFPPVEKDWRDRWH